MIDQMATWKRAAELLNEAEPAGEDVTEWIGYYERKVEAAQQLLALATEADAVAVLEDLIHKASAGIARLREVE